MNFGAKGLGNYQRGRCMNTEAFSYYLIFSYMVTPLTLSPNRDHGKIMDYCPILANVFGVTSPKAALNSSLIQPLGIQTKNNGPVNEIRMGVVYSSA